MLPFLFCLIQRYSPLHAFSGNVQKLFSGFIVVDQTSFQNDFSLVLCHLSQTQSKLFQDVAYSVGFNLFCTFLHCFADIRDEEEEAPKKAEKEEEDDDLEVFDL